MGLEIFDNYECEGQIELVKISEEKCLKCLHSGYIPGTEKELCCDYLADTGHSRIFVNAKPAYDPAYCDKFVETDIDRETIGRMRSRKGMNKVMKAIMN